MIHVAHVRADLKGGVDADLGEKTLIVGPNGRGKSAIVNAVELALGGTASDIVGRAEVKREADLIALGDGSKLCATATLSDGRVAEWETSTTKSGSTKKAKHTRPVRSSFPVRDVREALGGSPQTARTWLLKRIGCDVSREDVVAWLNDDLKARYERLAKVQTGSEVDILLGVIKAAESSARAHKSEIDGLRVAVRELSEGLPAEPTRKRLDDMERESSGLWTRYQTALRESEPAAAVPDLAQLRLTAETLIQQYDRTQIALGHLAEEMEGVPPLSDMDAKVAAARELLVQIHTLHGDHGAVGCLVCGSSGPVDHEGKALALARQNADLAARRERWRWYDAKREESESSLAQAQAAIAAFRAASDADQPVVPAPGALDALEAEWRAADERFREAKAAAGRWEAVRSKRERAERASRDQAELTALATEGKAAVDRLLKSATDAFIERVGSYLPTGDEFGLELERGGKPVCRFGLMRDGLLHTALSGAEWARLTLALACASCEADSADVLRIFTPEERAFDPITLNGVLRALSSAPGQVILTSPVRPKGRIPKGWTIVDVDASPAE